MPLSQQEMLIDWDLLVAFGQHPTQSRHHLLSLKSVMRTAVVKRGGRASHRLNKEREEELKGITKVIRMHPQGILNVCVKFNGNQSWSC